MADNSQKMAEGTQKLADSAGQAEGQAQVSSLINILCTIAFKDNNDICNILLCLLQGKASSMMDKASNAAQSAKDSMNEVQILLSKHGFPFSCLMQ